MDGSYQSLEALPIEHLQIVFVASSSCSDDDAPAAAASSPECQQRPATKKNLANGFTSAASPKIQDVKAKSKKSPGKTAAYKKVTGKDRGKGRKAGPEKKVGEEEEVLDAPPDGFPLRRVISIEEDHLPHLLQGGPQPLLHQLSEEDDEVQDAREAHVHLETSVTVAAATPLSSHPAGQGSREAPQAKKSHFSLWQPFGKETQQVQPELPVKPAVLILSAAQPVLFLIFQRQKKYRYSHRTVCSRSSWSATPAWERPPCCAPSARAVFTRPPLLPWVRTAASLPYGRLDLTRMACVCQRVWNPADLRADLASHEKTCEVTLPLTESRCTL